MTFAESEGRLRLRDEVTSDWADFQRLAEIGLADPEDTEHLTQALAPRPGPTVRCGRQSRAAVG